MSENWSKHSLISYESGVFLLRIEVSERFIGVNSSLDCIYSRQIMEQ